MIPPTTGTAVEMAFFVSCAVSASDEPLSAPDTARYPVNRMSAPVSTHVTALETPLPIRPSPCPGSIASAAAAAAQT